MSRRPVILLSVFLTVAFTGCGASSEPPPEQEAAPPPEVFLSTPDLGVRFDAPLEISLADLLAKPRAELATQADDLLEKIELKDQLHQQGQMRFNLLEEARLPLVPPVLGQAKFSAKTGLSLPPYHIEGAWDAALALHLARHGDAEGARLLADPKDTALLAKIDGLRLGRNYPVEWTRLVGLLFYHAEFRLAAGNAEAAHELVGLHQQLGQVLDDKARSSPLGAVLLPRGREMLRQATAAWRKLPNDELVQQAEPILAGWGECPPPPLAVAPGATRADVSLLLGNRGKGRAAAAVSAARGLDLLGLPFPHDAAKAVVAFFDGADHLTEVLVAYRGQVDKRYQQPAQLGHLLEERGLAQEPAGASDLPRRLYRFGGLTCDVALVPRNPAAGALVRFTVDSTHRDAPISMPRDLGAVHFDRSFSQNRLTFAPRQEGTRLTVTEGPALARLQLPVPGLQLSEAVLEREATRDVPARLAVRWSGGAKHPGLAALALPLWEQGGAVPIVRTGEQGARYLTLTWDGPQTRYRLQLPDDEHETPELEVTDRTAPQDLAGRVERVRERDRAERRGRLEANTARARLPRELENIKLGLGRAEVLALLPPAEGANVRRELPGGVLATFRDFPPEAEATVAREVFVRFDKQGRAVELRVRYGDGPGQRPGTFRKVLDGFKARCGAPEAVPGVAGSYRWQDDLAVLVCRQEGPGLDVILRAWPADQDNDPVPFAAYLSRGPENCLLGTTRDALLRNQDVKSPVMAGDALVLAPGTDSPYDTLLVWFEKGKVARIVARHNPPAAPWSQPAEAGQGIMEAWGRDAAALGWPRQLEYGPGTFLRSWANQDDATRVRIFWQRHPNEGLRLYTEWRDAGRP